MTLEDIRDGLHQALIRGDEPYTMADLEDDLTKGDAMLWMGERCALVTAEYIIDGVRCHHVWLSCGALDEMVTLEPGIAAYARARGCSYASINGRKGWERVFAGRGFTSGDGELRKTL